MEGEGLKDHAVLRVLAKWTKDLPEETENVRELCRRLCMKLGVFCGALPVSDLGTALTRAKCVAAGVPVESLNICAVDCMTPSTHRKGIHCIALESSLDELKLVEDESSAGSRTLQEFLWSSALNDGVSDEDVCLEAYSVMADVLHVFEDVRMVARLKIENSTLRMKMAS